MEEEEEEEEEASARQRLAVHNLPRCQFTTQKHYNKLKPTPCNFQQHASRRFVAGCSVAAGEEGSLSAYDIRLLVCTVFW